MELVNAYTSGNATSASQSAKASTPAPSSASANNASSQLDLTAARPQKIESNPAARLQQALASLDIPELENSGARVELNFNQDTGRVIAKITDRTSGEVLRELPSKELQQLFSQMREYLGSIVDEEI
jgi:flagellar protein FlaG